MAEYPNNVCWIHPVRGLIVCSPPYGAICDAECGFISRVGRPNDGMFPFENSRIVGSEIIEVEDDKDDLHE